MKILRINEDSIVPQKQSEGAAGFDLYSIEDGTIEPNSYGEIRTGLYLSEQDKKFAIYSRSGLAYRYGIYVSGKTEGEVIIFIYCYGKKAFSYKKGERVAQLIAFN